MSLGSNADDYRFDARYRIASIPSVRSTRPTDHQLPSSANPRSRQQTSIAVTTRTARIRSRVIAGNCIAVVDTQFQPASNDLAPCSNQSTVCGFSVTSTRSSTPIFRRQVRHCLIGSNKLGSTVWIATVVECVDTNEQVVATERFCKCESQR